MSYDALIVGGGPAGLSAALALGLARKRVLLCDAGPPRNAAAVHLHNFVTRDGVAPADFRRLGREQLAAYPTIEVRDVRVGAITGTRGAFQIELEGEHEPIQAKRILIATGMIDEMLPIEGFATLWGHSIFQCPYCHGWEVRDRAWGYLASAKDGAMFLHFALMARAWTRDLTVFTNGGFDVDEETQKTLAKAGIRLETEVIERLVARDGLLERIALVGGKSVPLAALFVHPPQRQVEVVRALGLNLDEHGFVAIDPMRRETSIPGIYAAGDSTTRQQGAIFGAAQGTHAAAVLNAELTAELALSGAL
jgi:thioredoxin reductase